MIKKPKMEIDDCSMTRQIPKVLYDEMIDALIECYRLIETGKTISDEDYSMMRQALETHNENIKESLIKAGCIFDE